MLDLIVMIGGLVFLFWCHTKDKKETIKIIYKYAYQDGYRDGWEARDIDMKYDNTPPENAWKMYLSKYLYR